MITFRDFSHLNSPRDRIEVIREHVGMKVAQACAEVQEQLSSKTRLATEEFRDEVLAYVAKAVLTTRNREVHDTKTGRKKRAFTDASAICDYLGKIHYRSMVWVVLCKSDKFNDEAMGHMLTRLLATAEGRDGSLHDFGMKTLIQLRKWIGRNGQATGDDTSTFEIAAGDMSLDGRVRGRMLTKDEVRSEAYKSRDPEEALSDAFIKFTARFVHKDGEVFLGLSSLSGFLLTTAKHCIQEEVEKEVRRRCPSSLPKPGEVGRNPHMKGLYEGKLSKLDPEQSLIRELPDMALAKTNEDKTIRDVTDRLGADPKSAKKWIQTERKRRVIEGYFSGGIPQIQIAESFSITPQYVNQVVAKFYDDLGQ